MNATKIEWVQNPDGTPGYTWNPLTGCLNHVNGLCKGGGFPCYAYRLANGRLKHLYLKHQIFAVGQFDDEFYTNKPLTDPFYPRFWPERATRRGMVRTWKPERKGIFVCDMSDLFGIGIPEEWTTKVLDICKAMCWHRFYLLTKQPQNLAKFSPFPPNCFVGVTVTSNGAMTLAMTNLAHIQAKVKFISFEPLLGSIGINDHMGMKGIVDWVIIGAQTKPYKPPRIEWVQEIVEAADKAGIPIFLKDNLKPLIPPEVPTFYTLLEPWNDIDPKPTLRQEMPQ